MYYRCRGLFFGTASLGSGEALWRQRKHPRASYGAAAMTTPQTLPSFRSSYTTAPELPFQMLGVHLQIRCLIHRDEIALQSRHRHLTMSRLDDRPYALEEFLTPIFVANIVSLAGPTPDRLPKPAQVDLRMCFWSFDIKVD